MNDFNYRRRHSSTVQIGNVPLGGDNPIRIQSMTSTSTVSYTHLTLPTKA